MASIKVLVGIIKQFIFLPAYLLIAYWTKDCSNHEDLCLDLIVSEKFHFSRNSNYILAIWKTNFLLVISLFNCFENESVSFF